MVYVRVLFKEPSIFEQSQAQTGKKGRKEKEKVTRYIYTTT